MYSIIVSIIVNYIVGVVLWYEIAVISFFGVGFVKLPDIIWVVKYNIFFLPIFGVCIWYNYKRYRKMVIGKRYRKITFHLTLWLPLFAYTVYFFFF